MTLTLEVPEALLDALERDPSELEREVRLAVAIDWFRRGLVSQGRAAEVAGLPRAEFFDELAARKIENIHVDIEELKREIELA